MEEVPRQETEVAGKPSVSGGDCVEAPAAPRSPSRRKISEDLESTPSPHKAGVQRNISMPKPMKL